MHAGGKQQDDPGPVRARTVDYIDALARMWGIPPGIKQPVSGGTLTNRSPAVSVTRGSQEDAPPFSFPTAPSYAHTLVSTVLPNRLPTTREGELLPAVRSELVLLNTYNPQEEGLMPRELVWTAS